MNIFDEDEELMSAIHSDFIRNQMWKSLLAIALLKLLKSLISTIVLHGFMIYYRNGILLLSCVVHSLRLEQLYKPSVQIIAECLLKSNNEIALMDDTYHL